MNTLSLVSSFVNGIGNNTINSNLNVYYCCYFLKRFFGREVLALLFFGSTLVVSVSDYFCIML